MRAAVPTNMTMPDATGDRMLVVLPQPAAAAALFEFALRIATRRRLRLHALIREPSELLTAGALPFVAEIDRCSGVRRPFDAASAARAIARLARDCEQQLRERARALRVDLSLEAMHGPVVTPALARLAGDDVLLLGSRAPWTSPGGGLTARGGCRVGVVEDGVDLRDAQAVVADLHAAAPTLPDLLAPLLLPGNDDEPPACDVLVLARHRAIAHGDTLRRFLERPQRVVVVLP